MAYEKHCESPVDYRSCRYGKSKLLFRGPKRKLDGTHVSFLGGTETYGRFQPVSYPAMFEEMAGIRAVNFGCVNAGMDVYLSEPEVLGRCRDGRLTVIEVMGAQNMTNRFYSVHPRRNDRFVRASELLQTIYAEVDFTEYNFTRHLLSGLRALSPERFALVRRELQDAWVARMRQLLERIGGPAVLLWFADHRPGESAPRDGLGADPLFVTRDMLEAVRPSVRDIVELVPSPDAIARGTDGMRFTGFEQPAAEEQLGLAAHEEAAAALAARLAPMLAD